jgi:hypothetical protein
LQAKNTKAAHRAPRSTHEENAMTGKFVWYELMTSDPKAAESYYRSVMGWDMKDAGMADAYTLLSAGPAMIGGLMAIPDAARAKGARPSWAGYIGVDDVDGTVQRVKSAGGTIHHPPTDIPGVGRFAVVTDPHGAAFIVFKPNSTEAPPPPPAPGTPGHVGWHELHAGERESDFAFYAKLFGWSKGEAHDMGPMGIYQLFATGGDPVGGIMTKTPDIPAPFWLYYFNVEAIDAATARATQGGGKVVNGPHEVPGGSWIVQCLDPQGAMFAMVAPKR